MKLSRIASMQKRSFACIHFGGQGDAPKVIEIALEYRDILQKAIETAEFFLNSGGLSHRENHMGRWWCGGLVHSYVTFRSFVIDTS
jgi:hypothetical protein